MAQSVAASFAPPLDREIRYDVIETRQRQGIALVFTLDERVRFARDGRGYRMNVTMQSARADVPTAIAQRFDAASAPFVGLDVALLLSAEGKPIGLADEAGKWSGCSRRSRRSGPTSRLRRASPTASRRCLPAMPPEARAAKLMEAPLRIVGYALPPMAPGASVENGDTHQRASATLKAVDAATLSYSIRTRGQLSATANLTGEGELSADRATGLLLNSITREWVACVGAGPRGVRDATITVKLVRQAPRYYNTRLQSRGFA